jgi:ATP-dependent RNA helicase DeaD
MDGLQEADISHGDYETYLPLIMEKFANISKEEILQRVVAKEFNRFLEYYENASDLNTQGKREDRKREPRSSAGDDRREPQGRDFRSPSGYQRLFVNLGTKDGFYKASFLQFILDMSDLRKDVLGKIDMRELNSWVEVDKDAAHQMIKAVDGKNFKGRRIRMNEA